MNYKLYTLGEQYVQDNIIIPDNFTGIAEHKSGSRFWLRDGFYHRENDLPACEYSDGCIQYIIDGNLHRLNGPAMISPNGQKSYYIHGKYICDNQEQFSLYVNIMKLKGLVK